MGIFEFVSKFICHLADQPHSLLKAFNLKKKKNPTNNKTTKPSCNKTLNHTEILVLNSVCMCVYCSIIHVRFAEKYLITNKKVIKINTISECNMSFKSKKKMAKGSDASI